MLKNILFDAGRRAVAVLVPGDREVSVPKLERRFFPTPVRAFTDADFERRGLVKGYVGPQGLGEDVTILADRTVRAGANWVTGANVFERHVTGANAGRDFRIDDEGDFVEIREGDACPICGAPLRIGRSIVVGHIYQLGDKYSKPLDATFVDEDGSSHPYLMGCYGIGISRIMATVVEQNHDDDGIVWPKALAPFEVVVVAASAEDEGVRGEAERIYGELDAAGVEAVIDDRSERAGVKFADADLVGYPVQVVVGKRGVEAGTADLKRRADGVRSTSPLADAARAAIELLGTAP